MGKLLNASESGDRLKTLKELRDMLAGWLENSSSYRDKAALTRQFVYVLAEIEEIESTGDSKKTSIADMREKLRAVK